MREVRMTSAAVLALAGLLAAATADGQGCVRDGRRGMVVGDLGFERLGCRGACSIRLYDADGVRTRTASFTAPPTVGGVRTGSGLREGDAIVAVDGQRTTTAAGANRLVNVAPGERVRLTFQRGGRTEEVAVTAGRRCEVPPAPPRPPAAPPVGTRVMGRPIAPAARPAPPEPPRPPRPPRPGPEGRRVIGRPVPDAPLPPPAPAAPEAPQPMHWPVPPVPPAPPAPPAPPEPPRVLPQGWFGFGVRCEDCEFRFDRDERAGTERTMASFGNPPEVWSVEPGTPAHRAGMRNGDRLLRIDGIPLTTREGGRRFAAVRPGQAVTWTYERGGETMRSRMTAARRPDAPRTPAAGGGRGTGRTPAAANRLRYSGRVAGAQVEVRGAPVTVERDPRTGELLIRSADLTVRVRPEGGTR